MGNRLPRNPLVSVSRACIDSGWVNNCVMCPIARAIGPLLPKGLFVRVYREHVEIHNTPVHVADSLVALYRLPKTATQFIDAYDSTVKGLRNSKRKKAQRHFQPFGFRMTLL